MHVVKKLPETDDVLFVLTIELYQDVFLHSIVILEHYLVNFIQKVFLLNKQ